MILSEPMPNELALAHEGRLAWVNCCISSEEFNAMLRNECSAPPDELKLNQLARVSGMTPSDYARQHSMLPVLRVAAKPGVDHVHGSDEAVSYSRLKSMLSQRRGAYCCTQCIKEDLQHWHFSWFRRTHHLIGVDWCPVHGIPLSLVDDVKPFRKLPHIWLEEGKLRRVEACLEQLPETGFLKRYVDIASALLQCARPFKPQAINGCLAQRVKELSLRFGQLGQHKRVSDLLAEVAPSPWLAVHVMNWAEKKSLAYFSRIDNAISKKLDPVSGDAYVMALAALFESAEDAMRSLESHSRRELPPARSDFDRRFESAFWHGEIWPHYVACRGNLNAMAKRLQVNKYHLREMLLKLGLPSLKGVGNLPKWRALVRFGDGEDFTAVCSAEQVDCADLYQLLRLSSARVVIAVKKAIQPSVSKSSKTEKSMSKRQQMINPARSSAIAAVHHSD